jgi:O-antigen/teichoic acid export membrane protein
VRSDVETFRRRLEDLTRLVVILAVASLGPIAAYSEAFIGRWVGGEHYAGHAVVLVAAASALVQAVLALWGWCFGGTGKVRLTVVPYLLATVLNLSLSVGLTFRYGLVGPLLGTLVTSIVVEIWNPPRLLRREFGVPIRSLARSALLPLIVGMPYAAGLWWLARYREPAGWAELLLTMALAGLFFLPVAAASILTAVERSAWLARVAALPP